MRRLLLCLIGVACVCSADLTGDQKLQDFRQLASLYAKHYAPYEWKRDVQKFDLLNISSWLERVARTRSDLEFYDLCSEFVASLNDAHSGFLVTSDFSASLGFSVDLYDWRPLVESINRTRLPANQYRISIGDELISIDGVPAGDAIRSLARYATAANNKSTARIAAAYLTSRSQRVIPRAAELGEKAVVVLRDSAGAERTLEIPWVKTGVPVVAGGPVPSPKAAGVRASRAERPQLLNADDPPYMMALRAITNARIPRADEAVLGWGARAPVFTMPANFTQRLGRDSADTFFSGTFEADGLRIGFIRIPSYSPASASLALAQFEREIQFFERNTDGLVIDNSRNPGGSVCYLEALMSYVMPAEFRNMGYHIRATSSWVASFSSSLTQARALRAEQHVIDIYEALLKDVQQANRELRGMTGALPLCNVTLQGQPARDRLGNLLAYTKPAMLLADELSASGGDVFTAQFQDNMRGPVFGWRTMGAGGTVVSFFDAAAFSEGDASITTSLMNRGGNVMTREYPSAPFVENIGVWPDIPYDYQTVENLMDGGRPYVRAFTDAIVGHIRAEAERRALQP